MPEPRPHQRLKVATGSLRVLEVHIIVAFGKALAVASLAA